jgi:hypothetical protein
MVMRALLLVLALIPAPGRRPPVAVPPPSRDLQVIAELVDRGETTGCGVLHTAAAMRYRVITVVRGCYLPEVLYVVHGCAEMPRSRYGRGAGTLAAFVPGERHHLVLEQVATRNWGALGPPSLITDYVPRRQPYYWAVRADPAPR